MSASSEDVNIVNISYGKMTYHKDENTSQKEYIGTPLPPRRINKKTMCTLFVFLGAQKSLFRRERNPS